MNYNTFLSLATLAVAVPALPANAVVPISGDMALRVGVYRVASTANGGGLLINNFSVDSDSWLGSPQALAIAAATQGTDSNGGVWSASGTGSSNWVSANQGSVSFQDYGWSFNIPNSNGDTIGANLDGHFIPNQINGHDWEYRFVASSAGTFTLNYDVSLVSGNGFGLQGWNFGSNAGTLVLGSHQSPVTNGQTSFNFNAGDNIHVYLSGQGDIGFGGGGPGTSINRSGRMNGSFSWAISEVAPPPGVPEPSTWLMMVAGFGLTGSVIRQKSRSRAAHGR